LRGALEQLEVDLKTLGSQNGSISKAKDEALEKNEQLTSDIVELRDNFTSLKNFNEELRVLVEEEREANQEERETLQDKLDQAE